MLLSVVFKGYAERGNPKIQFLGSGPCKVTFILRADSPNENPVYSSKISVEGNLILKSLRSHLVGQTQTLIIHLCFEFFCLVVKGIASQLISG
jgi:hypothetical protein